MKSLKIETREKFGRKLDRDREAGRLPAVIYGADKPAEPVFVNKIDFVKTYREAGESTVIKLNGQKGGQDALIYLVDWHPVSGQPVHVDFYAVRQDKLVTIKVPLGFTGVAPAEKELGGTVVKVIHELEIEALPKDLPHELKIDLTELTEFDSQISVSDVKAPAGVEIKDDPEEVIAMISSEVESEESEEEETDLSGIEVEKRGKEESEGEE